MTRETRQVDLLLASEIERRLGLFADAASNASTLKPALHALVGSAGMAGHAELALIIGQSAVRLAAGDGQARLELYGVLSSVSARLRAGEAPFPTRWPEPPPALRPSRVEPRYRIEYFGTVRDRLGELDAALASAGSAISSLEQAQRSVHTLKGAASAVGDDVTAWYCHGLEARLRKAPRTEPVARELLVDLARHRALLALLAEDSRRGLEALSAFARRSRPATEPPVQRPVEPSPELSRSQPPSDGERPEDASLRIPASALDALLERLDRVDRVHEELGRGSLAARRTAARLREVKTSLGDALRALGPPRPWGPSHAAIDRIESAATALSALSSSAERTGENFRQSADFLRARSDEMRRDVSALRKTTMGAVFERVAHAAARFAEAESKLLRVQTAGEDVTLDRRAAERLLDGLVQLVRNAVAHGILRPEERLAQGKRAEGTLWLRAERRGESLRIEVEDDGSGVDVERVRALAERSGLLGAEVARHASEAELLSLLFLPGLTTSSDPGLLAGRGLGLELVLAVVRGLGGSIDLELRNQGGLRARLLVPIDQTVLDVLWVEDAGYEFALPVAFTRRLSAASGERASVRLSRCLPQGRAALPRRDASVDVELEIAGIEPVAVSVERAGTIEEVTIRSLPRLIAATGPFSGAVLRGDGSLRLALDGPLLAARAWAKLGAKAL